jgi:ankyrin repeat protein
VDIVKAILDKGADINARDERGSSALTWAAVMDHSEVVKLLKSLGAKSDLWIASLTGDKDEAKQFLDKGADVNAVDGLGSTALMYAARKERVDVVELLLERGADPTKKVQGQTAYDRGLSRALGDLLLKKGIDILPKGSSGLVLVSACSDCRIDVVKRLLASGIDVNEANSRGLTPLMAASAEGCVNVAKALVGNGADLSQRDNKGRTALTHAVLSGALPVIKLLLSNGVDVNQRNPDGGTALMDATLAGQMESVKFLLANGADVNSVNKGGFTALNMNCYAPIRDLLTAHGAKKYKPGVVGRPPKF